jgi:PAS domain S-box-containing protein
MLANILVYDDSVSNKINFQGLLSGYEIINTNNEEKALKILKENTDISLIIINLGLTNYDFLPLLDKIKNDQNLANIPSIIITDENNYDLELKALDLRVFDFIRKPYHFEILKHKIDFHVKIFQSIKLIESKLSVQDVTYDILFQNSPIGIALIHNNDFIMLNPTIEEITGKSKEELKKIGFSNLVHPEDLNNDSELHEQLLNGKINKYTTEKRLVKPDGSIVWVNLVVTLFKLSSENQNNFIYFIIDITNIKKLEADLRENIRSRSVLLAHLPGMAYRCNNDKDWTMLFISEGCYGLTGYEPNELLFNRVISFNDVISPKYRDLLVNEWKRVLPNKLPFRFEYEITTKSGEKKWVLELGQGIYNDNGEIEALEGIIFDISNRKKIEDNLKYILEHDSFTGLLNRDYLEKLVESDMSKGDGVKRALIGINLSNVQLLTANYGFHYTQNLIKKTANMLSSNLDENYKLFLTYDNRFVVYVSSYQERDELVKCCDIITHCLNTVFETDRVNGGVAILEIDPNQKDSIDVLLKRLLITSERSMKMYDKEFKPCFYDSSQEDEVNREKDIRDILINVTSSGASDEFYLQYQPIWDLKTSTIFGFESLARLKSKTLGPISPTEFIPNAEKSKLIIPLGEKVLDLSFKFLNKLKNHGYENIKISVNISAIQLLKADFTEKLLKIVEDNQINPTNVELEITESIYENDYEHINEIITNLQRLGFAISIDDFGTGYSSIARGDELNVNSLKIDKSFMDKLLIVEHHKSIISDIISMAHRLGYNVVAEGVENEIQMRYLIANGCDRIQGYLISKPLNEDDAIKFLKEQHT